MRSSAGAEKDGEGMALKSELEQRHFSAPNVILHSLQFVTPPNFELPSLLDCDGNLG
jgi:hypothetical protein